MNIKEGIKTMLKQRGTTAFNLSKKLCNSGTYIYNVYKSKTVNLSTLYGICKILDYDIILVPKRVGGKLPEGSVRLDETDGE